MHHQSPSHIGWLVLHGNTGATSQGYWNKMFRGLLCSSIEMLKGSCSFSMLKRVKEFMGFIEGEGEKLKIQTLLTLRKTHRHTFSPIDKKGQVYYVILRTAG